MIAGLLVSLCQTLLPGPAEAAEVPRVAILYSSFRDGACTYRDECDEPLARLGWPSEKFENTDIAKLTERLDEFDLIIGTAAFNYEHPQDLEAHADRIAQFVRYGGLLLLTDTNYGPQVNWLPKVEPGLRIAPSSEECSSDGARASWVDVRHSLLAGVAKIPGVRTHPAAVSGLWHVLARCEEGRPILMYREIGDGIIVASHIYRQYGFPDVAFLQNLWLWSRDGRRIEAAREREKARYRALNDPKKLKAARIPAPVIDGIVEEDAWNKAARTSPFVRIDNSSVAEHETIAYIGLDDYYLYVAFRCADSDPSGLVMKETERDGAVYHDDCVELFVDPTGGRDTYRHFIVNAAGIVFDEATIDPAWDGWWQAAVQRHPRGWSAEVRVPLIMLGDVESFEDEWTLNLNRHYARTGELSAWSPTFGPFGAPAHFGTLENVEIDQGRFPVRLNRIGLEEGKLSVSLAKPSYGDLAGRYIVESISPSGRRKQIARQIRIKEYGSALIETEHRMEEPGRWTLRARFEAGGGPVWISEPITHDVPSRLKVTLPG